MEFTKNVSSNFSIGSYLLGNLDKEELHVISQIFFNYSVMFLPVLFIASVLIELLAGDDKSLVNLIRRTIYCIIFANTGLLLLEGTIGISFAITDAIIVKFASKYQYLKFFTVDDEDIWKKAASNFGDVLLNPHLSTIWLFTYLAITLIGKVYAVIYKFLFICIPFLSIISIFTLTKMAIKAVSATLVSLALFPIFCSIVMIAIGTHESPANDFIPSIPRMVNLGINALLIFWVPAITSGIVAGKGLHSVVEHFSSSTAMMGISMGKSFFMSKVALPLTMPARRTFFKAMGSNGFTKQFLQNPNKYNGQTNRASNQKQNSSKGNGSTGNSHRNSKENTVQGKDTSTTKNNTQTPPPHSQSLSQNFGSPRESTRNGINKSYGTNQSNSSNKVDHSSRIMRGSEHSGPKTHSEKAKLTSLNRNQVIKSAHMSPMAIPSSSPYSVIRPSIPKNQYNPRHF